MVGSGIFILWGRLPQSEDGNSPQKPECVKSEEPLRFWVWTTHFTDADMRARLSGHAPVLNIAFSVEMCKGLFHACVTAVFLLDPRPSSSQRFFT